MSTSVLIAGLATSPVHAGDWSGAYVGIHGGAAWGNQEFDLGPQSQLSEYFFNSGYLPTSISLDDASFAGGALAGYNWQSGALVLGVEADITAFAGMDRQQVVNLALGVSGYETTASAEVDDLATIRARLGLLVTPNTLLFVTGGAAFGRAEVSMSASDVAFVCPNTVSLCLDQSKSDWLSGWVAGGGAEFAITANWSLRGEYLHYDLGSLKFNTAPPPPHDDYVFSTRTDFSGDIARGTLNYRFDDLF